MQYYKKILDIFNYKDMGGGGGWQRFYEMPSKTADSKIEKQSKTRELAKKDRIILPPEKMASCHYSVSYQQQ